jgi:hypothetical protein
MNRYRKWLIKLFILCAAPLAAVGLFNYFMDPLWCFSGSHRWNNAQLDLNDRQQKTNALVFQKPEFDSILLGSSISTFINHNDFTGMKVYNYASPLMKPWEYSGYVANAKKAAGRDLKNIIIGMDFFGSNKIFRDKFDEPVRYYETANSFFYRYKVLFNIKTFDFSQRNLKQARKVTRAVYNREYVRSFPDLGPRKIKLTEQEKMAYQYNEGLPGILAGLKEAGRGANLTVFVTPISKYWICYYYEQGLLPDYERWLRELVGTFGTVYNFMYLNPVTEDDTNFFDAGHFYPKVGTLIARKITGQENGNQDFGVLVTPANIEDHLMFLRSNSRACRKQTEVPPIMSNDKEVRHE